MRRVASGFIMALALASLAAAPRVVTVTNPFSADVNGNGYALYNVGGFSATSVANVNENHAVVVGLSPMADADPSARGRVLIGDGGSPFYGYPSITAGTFDPSVQGVDLDAGSLFLRRVSGQTGELWFKVGPNQTDWQRIA